MYDLCEDAPVIIVTDNIDTAKSGYDRAPCSRLQTAIIRHLSATKQLPSLSIKTGFGDWEVYNNDKSFSLLRSVDALHAGSPVLFLDVRERKVVPAQNREDLIEKGKEVFARHCDKLAEGRMWDQLNTCAVAFFYDILFGAGNPHTSSDASNRQARVPTPIHRAIQQRQRSAFLPDPSSDRSDRFSPATKEQVIEVSTWVTMRIMRDQMRAHAECCSKGQDFDKVMGDSAQNAASLAAMLLSHPKFRGANVQDIEGCKRLVQSLVNMDRIPDENTAQGLKLLQQAWTHFDIMMHLAERYKRLSRVLYQLTLLFGVFTVTCTTSQETVLEAQSSGSVAGDEQIGDIMLTFRNVIFGLSMANTAVLLAARFFNPEARGRHLRASASSLESIIWLFRARIGPFCLTPTRPKEPDYALRRAIDTWHTEVVAGTDLLGTSLEAEYDPKVFRHLQYGGDIDSKLLQAHQNHDKCRVLQCEVAQLQKESRECTMKNDPQLPGSVPDDVEAGAVRPPPCADVVKQLEEARCKLLQLSAYAEEPQAIDDHQSPVRPKEYIELRLQRQVKFYKLRIPVCYRWRCFWELILAVCTITSATLGYFSDTTRYVAVSTAVATAVTSLGAHNDLSRRIERYTSAVRSIDKLKLWWSSLDDTDKASAANIAKLVEHGESIITSERLALLSAVKNQQEQGAAGDAAPAAEKDDAAELRVRLRQPGK